LTDSLIRQNPEIEIVVGVLSEKALSIEETYYDGYRLICIPITNTWPPTLGRQSPFQKRSSSRWQGRLRTYIAAGHYLLGSEVSKFIDRVKRLKLFIDLRRVGQLSKFPMLDDDFLHFIHKRGELLDIIQREEPDLIHADNYRSIIAVGSLETLKVPRLAMVRDNRFFCAEKQQAANIDGLICKTCSLGCVNSTLDSSGEIKALMKHSAALRQNMLRRFDKIVVTSKYLYEQIETLNTKKPLVHIANPSDNISQIKKWQENIEPAGPPEILIVGMVNDNKGQRIIPRLMKHLSNITADYRITVAGTGQLLTQIKKDVDNLGQADRLSISGFLRREALYRAFARSSIVVLPGIWPEPFGRVPLEAGLSRRPVITYSVGGYRETVIHEKTGLLVKAGCETDFIKATAELLVDKKKQKRLGDAAYEHVSKNYITDVLAKELAETWRHCVTSF
jgi:glycosyltransferase involved in cell wall biosynthesis